MIGPEETELQHLAVAGLEIPVEQSVFERARSLAPIPVIGEEVDAVFDGETRPPRCRSRATKALRLGDLSTKGVVNGPSDTGANLGGHRSASNWST